MAKTTVVTITDDMDGSTNDVVTCAFGLGSDQFEIDLNAEHREELENFLAKFIEHARPVRGGRATSRQAKPARTVIDRDRTQEVRTWLRDQGHEVNSRGRIKAELLSLYEEAHK